MTDFEDRLRHYMPSGPPPELRAQIVRELAGSSSFRIRDWLPALAVAALIALFAVLNHQLHADIDARLAVPDDLRPVEQWLPDDAGGWR